MEIEIVDEIIGQPGLGRTRETVRQIKVSSTTVTARMIVSERALECIATRGSNGRDIFAKVSAWGHDEFRPSNEEGAIARAIEAVARGEVLFFWNDQQIDDLDAELVLSDRAEATFLKLFPMKGG